jgi:Meiotically up-regulated gene 113
VDGTRARFWVASQVARHTKGFRPRTRLVWRVAGEPSAEELAIIAQECGLLTGNLRAWQTSGRMPKPRRVRIGSIYFLANGEGFIKIGFSADLKQRLSTLQVGSASEQRLLGTLVASDRTEAELKHRFRRLHVRGEWHRPEKVLLDFIAAEATPADALAAWKQTGSGGQNRASELPSKAKCQNRLERNQGFTWWGR